ncbi:MAG: ABC transporter ATP-binding protein [Acidimicrobiales bacterium]
MSALEIHGVAKRYGETAVLEDVNLSVPDGSTTAVLGASGSGKTTLLRLIAGFDQVDSGTIAIGGRVVDDGRMTLRAQHRAVGYVPQEGALFPHLTVARNVGFGVPGADRSRIDDMLELVGLTALARRYPHQLSGGQQQRVALARALATRPRVVLLDEPFSSLDASMRAEVRQEVARVLAAANSTTVLVTHDQDEALELADGIAVLQNGRVAAQAAPRSMYEDPDDLTAATALGEANLLPADIDGDRARCLLGSVPLRQPNGLGGHGTGTLLLRPEQLVLDLEESAGGVKAIVQGSQFHGHDMLVDVVIDDASQRNLLARVPGDLALASGQAVWIRVRGLGRVWSTLDPAAITNGHSED